MQKAHVDLRELVVIFFREAGQLRGDGLILFLCLYLIPLAGMGIDIYAPSLPHIVEFYNAHPALVKNTFSVYLLGYGIGQPFFGTASDSLGRKKPLVFGLIIYILIAFFCSISPNVTTLIILRFFQGIAVASPGSISKSIISDVYSGKALIAKASYMNIIWALGPIVAPGIGGYLQHYIGWQANFYFLTIYSLLGLVFVLLFLKETNHHKHPLQFRGILSSYTEILSHKTFIGAAIVMGVIYGMIVIFNTVAPFIVQVVLKQNAITYGKIAFVMGFAFLIGSAISRLLLDKKEGKIIIFSGQAIMLVASLLMGVFAWIFGVSIYTLTIPVFIILFGGALVFPYLMGTALGIFRERAGTASALMGCSFIMVSSLSVFFTSFLKTHSLIPVSIAYFGFAIFISFVYFFFIKN